MIIATTGAAAGSGSSEGSIFSMVGPGGAAAPIVAYDFTRYDPTLTSSQNIVAANRSGDATLDLSVVVGAALSTFLTADSTQGTPHAWRPFACAAGGGALFTGSASDYVRTSGGPASIRFVGAMTSEWLGYITVSPTPGYDFHILWFDGGAGETEDTNSLFLIRWENSSSTWKYQHESGAGVDSNASFFSSSHSRFAEMRLLPQLFTLTRSGAGVVRLYINGYLAAPATSAIPAFLPTGGETSNLFLGYGGAGVRMATLGLRLFNAELTAAQVRASYQRTFFGVSA